MRKLGLAACAMLISSAAWAGRPFTTEDAGAVDARKNAFAVERVGEQGTDLGVEVFGQSGESASIGAGARHAIEAENSGSTFRLPCKAAAAVRVR